MLETAARNRHRRCYVAAADLFRAAVRFEFVREKAGIGCWIAPRTIPPGAEYGDLIDRAIGDCKVFPVVYSAASAGFEAHPAPAADHSGRRRLYLIGFCCAALFVLLGGVYLLRSPMAGRSVGTELVDGRAEETFDGVPGKAEAGDSLSQCRTGEVYRSDPDRKDLKEAARWFLRAAEQGLPEAQFSLGHCYVTGRGGAEYGCGPGVVR